MHRLLIFAVLGTCCQLTAAPATSPNTPKLLVDLDADQSITVEEDNRISKWSNIAPSAVAKDFVSRDEGRKKKGSGRPTLRKNVKELNDHNALIFRQGELVNMEEDTFDGLTTGKGFTWFCVIAMHEQRVGLKDVNSFLGNLRNGGKYEGFWANVRDDNTVWTGARNGLTFGRFDENNPLVLGPTLEKNRFYIVASRMPAGTGPQPLELFVNSAQAVATEQFPVQAEANPSRLVIGQERDAIQHPGHESFDGEIARVLIYEGALDDDALKAILTKLKKHYGL